MYESKFPVWCNDLPDITKHYEIKEKYLKQLRGIDSGLQVVTFLLSTIAFFILLAWFMRTYRWIWIFLKVYVFLIKSFRVLFSSCRHVIWVVCAIFLGTADHGIDDKRRNQLNSVSEHNILRLIKIFGYLPSVEARRELWSSSSLRRVLYSVYTFYYCFLLTFLFDVMQELDLLKEHEDVYKLVGPLFVKQDPAEPNANIVMKIGFISAELYVSISLLFSMPWIYIVLNSCIVALIHN